MPLPALELGGIQDPYVRRAFEQVALRAPFTDADFSSTAAIQESRLASGSTGLAKGAFSAYRNAALSVGTTSGIVFDTEEFDVSSWFDTSNGRFTPLVAGYYQFSWAVGAGGAVLAADTYWRASIAKNGTTAKKGQVAFQRGAAITIGSVGSTVLQANGSSDFFTVIIEHNTGGSQAIANTADATYFQGGLLGRS